jgi:carbamate kinase
VRCDRRERPTILGLDGVMRIVIALGGNALLARGEKPDASVQLSHLRVAAAAIAPLAAEHDLLICHGNGPQVGLLSVESEDDDSLTRPYPLDDLVAETQGMIGYWLVQALRNAGVRKPIAALITQTVVDADDPALSSPTKFIGPVYSAEQARQVAAQRGWTVAADGRGWRRVVSSPEPQRIVEQASVDLLLQAGTVVVCGGGGGSAVVEDAEGGLSGIEAVVDKDFVASRLAVTVDAARLLVLTDVAAVMRGYGTPTATPIARLDVDDIADMEFAAGSMAPKIEACRRFVMATGRPAGIGALADARALLEGAAGTVVVGPPQG